MIEKQTIEYLRLIHGAFNFIVMLLFVYQASLGLRIRSNRKKRTITPEVIKRHRRFGPILAVLGITGFFAGISIIYLDYGHILKYPLHFIVGSLIAFSIITTYFISRKIKGAESSYRNSHFIIGLLIISLYLVQIFIGLGILL
ncbi:MAG: hypothetical protein A2X59_02065 [Nitrospirae bacterium GWC2_42_7]|nr:MAG: hypothetical protein A2X59_02065 [Nitrospirae bacterium GWC2_42_7]